MKTVIILLCVVMIGFGYLLSDNINTQEDLAQLQQQVSQLEQEKKALQNKLDATLTQLAETEQANHELTQHSAAQAETIRQWNILIGDQKKQISNLQTRVAFLQALVPIQKSLFNASQAGVFLPVIPALLATTYIVVRSSKHAPWKSKKNTDGGGTWVQLTESEVEKLIRLRRMQHQ